MTLNRELRSFVHLNPALKLVIFSRDEVKDPLREPNHKNDEKNAVKNDPQPA